MCYPNKDAHQDQVSDEGERPIGEIETNKPSQHATRVVDVVVAPCPSLVPDEVVEYGRLYRKSGCQKIIQSKHAGVECQAAQLYCNADATNGVELQTSVCNLSPGFAHADCTLASSILMVQLSQSQHETEPYWCLRSRLSSSGEGIPVKYS